MTTAYKRLRASVDRVMPIRPDDLIEVRAADVHLLLVDYVKVGLRNGVLNEALELAEAALADIGDADREPGDDLAWCERRAAKDLPRIRDALQCEDEI